MRNQVLETIHNRRSIRKYKDQQITDEELNMIIEAGRYAPSGGNNQTTHFIVIQNQEVLQTLKRLAVQEFSKMEVSENTYRSLRNSIIQSKKGNYDFIYNAPTFVIVTNLRGYGNAIADCAVALENMMIAAASLNIGSCWINQLKWLADNEVIKDYVKELGIDENQVICGGLSLGYPVHSDLKPLERKGNVVTIIK